ncbi:MarR family winged helix-turn-helix transcriptional regulator [Sphingopyxis sp. LC363]|uniref:MarR family winged helix-turn-helix transcriptional regulator n=1 Tax=Sphingopyxis sp. LC363 TaxID=1120705 RepID=UPI00050EC0ED|nr:MarR family winged helix-turn-helix transcriptional regulator [Sphingopyxis sp. LC363]KGB54737.1 putative transcriptional regulator, MarR [Sphingopyxis sp. LC363]
MAEIMQKNHSSQSKQRHLDTETSFGYMVRRCHRRFDRLLSHCLSPHGVKPGFWYYLRVLWIRDGVTQRHLSEMTNVSENTTVSMIAAMENAGFVARQRDDVDRRKIIVTLTKKGQAFESKLIGDVARINEIATSGIESADLETCARVLTRMSENLAAEWQGLQTSAKEAS